MNKKGFLILLLLFTSFCSSMPMVIAGDPVLIFGEINTRDNWCIYSKIRYYRFKVYLFDQDGATDISKVYLRATDNEYATIFELRADNLNSTPTYSIQTGEDIIDLNESACKWIEDGDYGWAHFYVMTEWDCPIYESCGIYLYAEDSDGNSDGWEQEKTDYYDMVSRLTTDNFTSTGSTIENVGELITVEGYLRYACTPTLIGINESSPFSPPASELNILHLHDSSNVSVANTIVIDSEGYFNMSFNLPSVAQEKTYHLYIDMVDDYTDGDALDGDTIAITVTDQSSGWPSIPGIPSIPDIPSIPTGGDGAIAPVSKYVNLGIFFIVGAVAFALFWKEAGERNNAALKKFQSRRDGSQRTSKEKEKQVPKAFKGRRK